MKTLLKAKFLIQKKKNQQLKNELKEENQKLQEENQQLINELKEEKEENQKLQIENQQLKKNILLYRLLSNITHNSLPITSNN